MGEVSAVTGASGGGVPPFPGPCPVPWPGARPPDPALSLSPASRYTSVAGSLQGRDRVASLSAADDVGGVESRATGSPCAGFTFSVGPVAQLRRLVPDTAVQTQPGRAVRTLTISQSPAED
ncbi:hypothetical protein, partial [Streptomyces sp. wa22]|uniref:hypothetical protein n=1 Tax=Streptomyces sp. wa22 TaxID=1828244 RepID=UPI0012CC0264